MAIDKRLQIFDDEGNPVDYDIMATDVKFSDGKDLPTKLTELEGEIGSGGYAPPAGGIPKTDLSSDVQTSLGNADTAYQKPASGIPATDLADGVIPDTSNLATKTEVNTGLAAKVDKVTGYGLSKNDYTDADQAAVGTIGSKANDNVVVKSISVNGGEAQTPTQGNVNINVQGAKGDDGITPQIGSNGNWFIGETDTGTHAQGPAGTSYTSADLVIGNALNGQGDVLGMSGAMMIKNNLDSLYTSLNRLYTKLANMAFWTAADQAAAAPTPIDWSVPQITVTLDKTGVSANAMITDDSDQEITGTSVLVDEGSGLTLKIKPRADHAITAASATIGGVSQTLTDDNGVYTLEIDSVSSAITIVFSVSAAAVILITYNTLSHCAAPSGVTNPTGVMSGQPTNIVLEVDSGYVLTSNEITISGATIGTITHSDNVYTIPITHDGTSQSISFSAAAAVAPIKFLRGYYIDPNDGKMYNYLGGENGTTYTIGHVVMSEYIHVPNVSNGEFTRFSTFVGNKRAGSSPWPSAHIFYKKESDGTFTKIWHFGWNNNSDLRTETKSGIAGNSYIPNPPSASGVVTALESALAADALYVRACLYVNENNGVYTFIDSGSGNPYKTQLLWNHDSNFNNGTYLFYPWGSDPDAYEIVEAADWDIDDLSQAITQS